VNLALGNFEFNLNLRAVNAIHIILWLEKLFWRHKSRSESKFTTQIFWVSYSCLKKNI